MSSGVDHGRSDAPGDSSDTGREADADSRAVLLLGYEPSMRAALYEHLDDLFRELTVIELAGDAQHSARLRTLVADLRDGFDAVGAVASPATLAAVLAADDGEAVDIELVIDPRLGAQAARLGKLFDEVDGLAADGQLLTGMTPPAVRLFREWVLHEIVEQVHGAAPLSWPEWRDEIESRWRPAVAGVDDVFRLMADAAPVLIWVVGDGGVGTFFNRRWLEFTGVDLNAGERRWTDVVHPHDRRLGLGTFRRAIRSGEAYEMEYRLRRADGVYRWMLDRGVPRYDAGGTRVGMIGSCVDITDRRTVEDELRVAATQAELAFEAGQMGYWRWSSTTRELRVGRALKTLLAMDETDELATFEEYLERVHDDDRDRVASAARRAFETGGELQVEHRISLVDGDERWFEIRGRPIQTDDARAAESGSLARAAESGALARAAESGALARAAESGSLARAAESGALDHVTEWVGVAFDITSAAQRSQARSEMLGQAVRARRDVERANATLRQAVGRLDSMVRQEHAVADALQRALFTDDLPTTPGLELAGRYLPGSAELTVGGDWYDVIVRPSGVLLVIGDVAGHGLHAAAVMARIRHSVHFAVSEAPDDVSPATVLGSVNRYVLHQGDGDLATVALVQYEVSGRLRHARAGHPPVVVAPATGPARFLDGGLGPPLGAIDGVVYPDAEDRVAVGDTLVLYTDGLVERRREPLDRSLARLRQAIDAAPPRPEDLLDAVLGDLLDDEPADDVAVLAARITAPDLREWPQSEPGA